MSVQEPAIHTDKYCGGLDDLMQQKLTAQRAEIVEIGERLKNPQGHINPDAYNVILAYQEAIRGKV